MYARSRLGEGSVVQASGRCRVGRARAGRVRVDRVGGAAVTPTKIAHTIERELQHMRERTIKECAKEAGAYLRVVFDQPTMAGEVEAAVLKLMRPTEAGHARCPHCGFTGLIAKGFGLKTDGSPQSWCRRCRGSKDAHPTRYGEQP